MPVRVTTQRLDAPDEPDDVRVFTVTQMPLVAPTRLEFELGHLLKATFYTKDNRLITYELFDEVFDE